MTTTEMISSTFENGKRVVTQRVTHEKSDDLFTLANLQRQYESVLSNIAKAGDSPSAPMLAEKDRLEKAITDQEAYVAGYSG